MHVSEQDMIKLLDLQKITQYNIIRYIIIVWDVYDSFC